MSAFATPYQRSVNTYVVVATVFLDFDCRWLYYKSPRRTRCRWPWIVQKFIGVPGRVVLQTGKVSFLVNRNLLHHFFRIFLTVFLSFHCGVCQFC